MDFRKVRIALVGLGPTNIAIAHALAKRGIDAKDILAIDGRPPMGHMTTAVSSIHMDSMRSGWEANVTGDWGALWAFNQGGDWRNRPKTPPWKIFRQHTLAVWDSLSVKHLPFQVGKLARWGDDWIVGDANNTAIVESRLVIVATGLGPHRKETIKNTIALPLYDNGKTLYGGERVAIIGAGLTAAHTATFLAQERDCHVTLFAPHGIRTANRDAKDEWFSTLVERRHTGYDIVPPKMQGKLHGLELKDRYKLINEGLNPGTVTSAMKDSLQALIADGKITVVQTRISDCRDQATPGKFTVIDPTGEQYGPFDVVYDARGHRVHVDNLDRGPYRIAGLRREIGAHHYEGLPFFRDETCQIQPGLVLAGALTPLAHGPVAHTLAGALRHARILAQALPL